MGWEVDKKIDKPGNEYHGKPYVVSKRYTASLNEKSNLSKDLAGWVGIVQSGFDIETLIGKSCLVTVTHSEDGKYVNVTGVAKLVEGMENMKAVASPEAPAWVKKLQESAGEKTVTPEQVAEGLKADFDANDIGNKEVPF